MPGSENAAGVATSPDSRLERSRARKQALQARAQRISDRANAERSRHASLDALYDTIDRDSEVGGGIIAGALAYRFFIWLLPFALVLVAGLGIAADAASTSPDDAARTLGLAGLVSGSIASAAKSSSRWYALLVGIPILVYATRSLLRTLIAAHRLVWGDLRAAAPRPTLGATMRLLGLLLLVFASSGLAGTARAHSPALGLLASVALAAAYVGIWLLVSQRLPHRRARWTALVPGAVVVGAGLELVQLVAAYVLAPMSLNKQGTYGALGIAAGLLLGLYLVGRVLVAAAALSATLWERRA